MDAIKPVFQRNVYVDDKRDDVNADNSNDARGKDSKRSRREEKMKVHKENGLACMERQGRRDVPVEKERMRGLLFLRVKNEVGNQSLGKADIEDFVVELYVDDAGAL